MRKKVLTATVFSLLLLVLASAVLPLSDDLSAEAHAELSGFTYEVVAGPGARILTGPSGHVSVPATIDGLPVTAISYGAWHQDSNLLSIVVPGSVGEIPSYSFWGCSSLETVVLHEGVTSIGSHAFLYCQSLQSIIIPNSVTNIGESAFRNCLSLESITIPEGVTAIQYGTFLCCESLTSFTIPSSVTAIGALAFYGCSSLEEVFIPQGVTSVGKRILHYCDSLRYIEVSSSNPHYQVIGDVLFDKSGAVLLSHLTGRGDSYDVPSGVLEIGEYAFSGCYNFNRINIPDTVAVVGDYAFEECGQMRNLHFGAGVGHLGVDILRGNSYIESVSFAGDAPSCSGSRLTDQEGLVVYHHASAAGFTSPSWLGAETRVLQVPSAVINFRAWSEWRYIELEWLAPDVPGGPDLSYAIFLDGKEVARTADTRYLLEARPGDHEIIVLAVNVMGMGDYTPMLFSHHWSDRDPLNIAVGAITTALMIAGAAFIIKRRRLGIPMRGLDSLKRLFRAR